jgi:hypothetical protein
MRRGNVSELIDLTYNTPMPMAGAFMWSMTRRIPHEDQGIKIAFQQTIPMGKLF